MQTPSTVLAVVDAVDDGPVVWWVDLGLGTGMSRLGGAWVLSTESLRGHLAALTAGRMTLATSAGQDALHQQHLDAELVVDPVATLEAVVAVRDELHTEYERMAPGRGLTAPSWPILPTPLDPEQESPKGAPLRALVIARWFDRLCGTWEAIERQRLARSYLRQLGGDAMRVLPVALLSAQLETV